MDRNLGASQVATSSSDANAYGDLYQWGRNSDGHQCRNSPTTNTLSSINTTINGNFILSTGDWLVTSNNNLWQGVNGINNPCPSGYRLPTFTELVNEQQSWPTVGSAGAFGSPLKLTLAGYHHGNLGAIVSPGSAGYYWSSTVNGLNAFLISFNSNFSATNEISRSQGYSVRCLKH
jgi:hypothetical protein